MLSITIDLTDTRRLTAYPDRRIIVEQRADVGCAWAEIMPTADDRVALLEARDLLRSLAIVSQPTFSDLLGL